MYGDMLVKTSLPGHTVSLIALVNKIPRKYVDEPYTARKRVNGLSASEGASFIRFDTIPA